MAKASFITVGCKLNQYETEMMAERLSALGFQRVAWAEEADLYVVNSCNVTQAAVADSRRKIRAAHRIAPAAKIVVTGCAAQLQGELLAALPEVALVVSNRDKEQIAACIERLFPDVAALPAPLALQGVGGLDRHTRALVKVQDGCDQQCSYCIVPLARGPERSRLAAEIVAEVAGLCEGGYQEVVLTGVHIGRYRDGAIRLAQLLQLLLERTEIRRIRVSSIEVDEIDTELMNILQHDRVCPHLHLPLQSACDRILRLMKRPYRQQDYLRCAENLKQRVPNLMIGADVIVGFPSESDSDFAETMSFVGSSPIDYLHVFSYSDHTQAASFFLNGKVPAPVRGRRNRELTQLGDIKWKSFLKTQLQRLQPVLFEKRLSKYTGRPTGLSDNYIRVECEGGPELFNSIRMVRPTEIFGRCLLGKLGA